MKETFSSVPHERLFENGGVRVRTVQACVLCGKPGQLLYSDLRDRLFDAPGTWTLLRCEGCGLVWLNPQPTAEDVPKLYYQSYYTHHHAIEPPRPLRSRQKLTEAARAVSLGYEQLLPGASWRWAGRLISLIPPWRDYALASLLYLRASARGRLLDVGCGTGEFLAAMRTLGWEVQGVEPDPQAAAVARDAFKLPVVVETLEEARLLESSFDAVTLSHVIEHVLDPHALLKECGRVLKKNGQLVIVTPNVQSLGHLLFRRSWFALEPPRHLHMFSIAALRRAARGAGLTIKTLRTTSRLSRIIFTGSAVIARHGRCSPNGSSGGGRLLRIGSWSFWAWEDLIRHISPGSGEEILLVAQKPAA